jgi:hypothetical protein
MDTKQLMINFTPAKLGVLKEAYGQAVSRRLAEFEFEGRSMPVSYASYLVKYLEREFGLMEIVV